MQLLIISLATLAILAQSATASWSVTVRKTNCDSEETGFTAGQPGDELWCIASGQGHSVETDNIEADGMQVFVFESINCQGDSLATIDTNGCQVIPSDTTIAAVRVLPKDA